MDNLATLQELKNKITADLPAVDNAKITNPAKEMEASVSDFLSLRLSKLTEDADFERAIKDNILQRLPEASFKELTTLLHNISSDNTHATDSVLSVFYNEQSGKNIIDTLKDDSIAGTATEVYNSIEDRNVLQALSYLNQIMTQLSTPEDKGSN